MKRKLFKAMMSVAKKMELAAGWYCKITKRIIWVVLIDEDDTVTIRKARVIAVPDNHTALVAWVDQPGEGLVDFTSCHFTLKRAERWGNMLLGWDRWLVK